MSNRYRRGQAKIVENSSREKDATNEKNSDCAHSGLLGSPSAGSNIEWGIDADSGADDVIIAKGHVEKLMRLDPNVAINRRNPAIKTATWGNGSYNSYGSRSSQFNETSQVYRD
jgi:hypothetical protein